MTTKEGGRRPAVSAEAMIAEARKALWVMVTFLAVIWIVQVFNALDGYDLSQEYGIRPHDLGSLPDVFSAPFLHISWDHIEGNSGPLFIFGFLAAYRGVKKFLGVSLLILLASGIGEWLTGPSDAVAVGASGMLFGYFGYILVRGIFDRHPIDIVLGLVMGLCFAYQFSVLLPTDGIAWQAHAFGFASAVVGGFLFRDRRPKKQAAPPTLGTDLTPLLGDTTPKQLGS